MSRDDDVDIAAVERAMVGQRPAYMTRAERQEVTRRLTRVGTTQVDIARMLGVSRTTVSNLRMRSGVGRPQSPPGATREAVRKAMLADPALSIAECARNLQLHRTTVQHHRHGLVRDGLLPERADSDVRRPRRDKGPLPPHWGRSV